MIKAKVRVRFDGAKLKNTARAGSIQSLGKAGAYIRGIAKRSIKLSPAPAPPGHQPHSRKGRLKRAIVYAVEKAQQDVVIGPAASAVGRIGHTHEFGGTEPPKKRKARKPNWKLEVGGHGPIEVGPSGPKFAKLKTDRQVARAKEVALRLPASQGGPPSTKARKYPPRPFMGPALEIGKAKLPKMWTNSVKGG